MPASEQAVLGKAERRLPAQNEMIEHPDLKERKRTLDPASNRFVSRRGAHFAARMIGGVHECHHYLSHDGPAVESGVMSSPRLYARRVAREGAGGGAEA